MKKLRDFFDRGFRELLVFGFVVSVLLVIVVRDAKVSYAGQIGGATSIMSNFTGVLPVSKGGTGSASFVSPTSAVGIGGTVNCALFYNGTSVVGDNVCEDFGYDTVSGIVHTERIHIHSAQTTVAQFLNTTPSAHGSLVGAGMIGYSDPGEAVQNGDRLGFFLLGGATNGTHSLANAAGMGALAAENWSATNQGASMVIYTTPIGSTTAARRIVATFGSDGTASVVGGLRGTTTNDSACVGCVGEYVESNSCGSPTVLTSNSAVGVASATLGAGDWDVFGAAVIQASNGASVLHVAGGSNTTNGVFAGLGSYSYSAATTSLGTDLLWQMPIPTERYSLAASSPVFLNAFSIFSPGSSVGCGVISARRIR